MEQEKNVDNLKLSELVNEQKIVDRQPFQKLRIDDASVLDTIEGREICPRCYKSRKFFCYSCYTPVIDDKLFPRVKLPLKVDIIKHLREIDGKSTAVHAKIIAPDDVNIYTYPDFPEWSPTENIVLIFPSKTAKNVEDLFWREKQVDGKVMKEKIEHSLPITRVVFIDCTWHQTTAIYKDQRLKGLPCVILRKRISQFWRHQKKSPRWYLATVEALHEFLVELHSCAFGHIENYNEREIISKSLTAPYQGQYDNLLYFFKYMYDKIHWLYDHEKLYAYKRPLL